MPYLTPEPRGCKERIESTLLGGFLGGLIGLLLGAVWAAVLESNTGPLAAIFGTGPLGFAIGAIIGALYQPKDRTPPPSE